METGAGCRNLKAILASLAALGMAAFALGAPDAPLAEPDLARLDRYVRAEMSLNGIPGAAVAVAAGGRTLALRAYGVRSVATGEPMTADTPVELASVSKSFTALAAARLAEQGRLNFSLPVKRYLPRFTLRGPEPADRITVRHLLQQTSGLTRYADRRLPCCGHPAGNDLSSAVERLREVRLRHAPGEKFRYANSNYVLLAAVIERISGAPFPEWMRKRIFEPLDMPRTTLLRREAEAWGLAAYHEQQWGRVKLSPSNFSGWFGASEIKSTAEDMARYLHALLDRGPDGWGRYVAERIPPEDPPPYHMGWFFHPDGEQFSGVFLWEHSGDVWGANSAAVLAPERNAGVAVLLNLGAHRASGIARGVLGLVRGRFEPEAEHADWRAIPDNWAVLFTAGGVVILAVAGFLIGRFARGWRRGERRFERPATGSLVRSLLLAGMSVYVLSLIFFSSIPLRSYPTTMQFARPFLAGSAAFLLLTTAVLGLASRTHQGSRPEAQAR